MSDKSPTFSEFNPSNSPLVDEIKAKTDELIALVNTIPGDGAHQRRKAIAVTNYEQAAMWAVKAVFS